MGRELLEGVVLDRNANFMASHLTEAGFRVRSIQIVDDLEEEAVPAFQRALSLEPTFILVTGGMGPGHDDNTRECLAKAAGVPLVVDETAKEHLANSYRRLVALGIAKHAELNEARLSMATVPEGSVCFENPVGSAPAVRLDVGKTTCFLLPGQPEELRRMFQAYVEPALAESSPGSFRAIEHFEIPGLDESAISRMLDDLERRHPTVNTRARVQGDGAENRMRISLACEAGDEATAKGQLSRAAKDLRARLGLEVAEPAE